VLDEYSVSEAVSAQDRHLLGLADGLDKRSCDPAFYLPGLAMRQP